MGLKQMLEKALSPFALLFHALFSPRGRKALRLAYQELAKTPLGQIIVAAIGEIASLKNDARAGYEKHEAAFKKIVAEADKQKIAWKESLINLGIELGVQALKGNL